MTFKPLINVAQMERRQVHTAQIQQLDSAHYLHPFTDTHALAQRGPAHAADAVGQAGRVLRGGGEHRGVIAEHRQAAALCPPGEVAPERIVEVDHR